MITELLEGFDAAISRRWDSGWAHREQARLAFEVAKSDYASLGADPLADSLAELVDRFGLSGVDASLLAVAVAPELDLSLQLLCGLLSGDDGPARPTVALAFELAGIPFLSGPDRGRLADIEPLRRHRLVSLEGDGTVLTRRLRAHDRVVLHLLGSSAPVAGVVSALREVVPVAVAGTATVVEALRTGAELVWVYSPPGTAGMALAAAACTQLEVAWFCADLRLSDDPSSLVADLLLEAGLTGSVLILVGAERVPTALRGLGGAAVPVVAIGAVPWDPLWSATLPVSVTAPRAAIVQRAELWRSVLGTDAVDAELSALRLTPEEIVQVGRYVSRSATGPIDPALVRQATRRLGRSNSTRAAPTTSATLDDLVLPDHTHAEVVRLLSWVRYRDEVLAQGPLQGKGGKGSGICVLFSGSPGTGKTLAAHVIADSLGMDLLAVEVSGVVDKYIGETEKNLEKVFAEAESLNAVLFFDEADALFGSRSEVKDAKDRYANQEIAYLLQRMEQFDGITVLATNLRGNLDPAFSRRLHFVIHFPDPDVPTRERLWEHHLANLAGLDGDDPIDVRGLAAAVEMAGGDIRNIVLAAAYAAAAESGSGVGALVGMRHIRDAVVREHGKLGRRVPPGLA